MSPTQAPKGWEVVSIESVSDVITKGATPTTYGHSYTESGIPFLRAENVLENKLDLSETKYISQKTHFDLYSSIPNEAFTGKLVN